MLRENKLTKPEDFKAVNEDGAQLLLYSGDVAFIRAGVRRGVEALNAFRT